jgi:hypothetical protein
VADLTGLQIRLGGGWVSLPWSDVASVGVGARRRLGDGRIVVNVREERKAVADPGLRVRFALLLNHWWYDAALVVPYGITARVSVDDIPAELVRLADGRAEVVVLDEHEAEPMPTVEIAAPDPLDPAEVEPEHATIDVVAGGLDTEPEHPQRPERPERPEPVGPRRLAAAVSALRAQGGRRSETGQGHLVPATAGTLALAHEPVVKQVLPEQAELRRRPPEDEPGLRAGMAAARLTPLDHDDRRAEVAIGDRVREAREWLGLSVDDLAERTRIRPFVIESIEVGDFSACGGDFYARGHLRMLAGTLGIEAEPLLAGYDQHIASDPVSPRAVFDAELSRGVVRPAGTGSRWGALIGTVVVLVLVWAGAKIFFDGSGIPLPVQHPGVHHPNTSGAAHHPSINDPRIGNALPPPAPPTHVSISATTGSSRVVVRDASAKFIYQGILQAGQSAGVSGEAPLRVMAADGGVVTLSAPGHPTRTMGDPGKRAFRRIPG